MGKITPIELTIQDYRKGDDDDAFEALPDEAKKDRILSIQPTASGLFATIGTAEEKENLIGDGSGPVPCFVDLEMDAGAVKLIINSQAAQGDAVVLVGPQGTMVMPMNGEGAILIPSGGDGFEVVRGRMTTEVVDDLRKRIGLPAIHSTPIGPKP